MGETGFRIDRIVEIPAGKIRPGSPLEKFLDYYRNLAAEGVPHRSLFDVMQVPRPCLAWLFVVDVTGPLDGLTFRFRLTGTRNVELVGQDSTGMSPREAYGSESGADIERCYGEVVNRREPIFWRAHVPRPDRAYLKCQRGVFPFADDSGTVTTLIGLLVPDEAAARAFGLP